MRFIFGLMRASCSKIPLLPSNGIRCVPSCDIDMYKSTLKRGRRTVEEMIKAFKCQEPEKRISVLRLELDYELALLHEAMMQKNTHRIDQCKARLRELRQEMMMLEAL